MRAIIQPLRVLVDGLVDEVLGRDADVDAMTLDVNAVRAGTLFCARRDWWGDTHRHLALAVSRGAPALLVSRPEAVPAGCPVPVALARAEDPALGLIAARLYGAPTARLKVYGVTGTNGKTTTTWLIHHLLSALGERPALMGTLGYGFERASVPATNTTPDALVIQRLAADALDRGATALVLEISSHALAVGRTAGVLFDSVGFTQMGRDHLDFHGDERSYRAAKARLFDEALRRALEGGKVPSAAAVLDDPQGAYMLDRAPVSALRRGLNLGAGPVDAGRWVVRGEGSRGLDGRAVRLHTHHGEAVVDLPLLGDFNEANAGLAALMVAATHPGDWRAAWSSLSTFGGVPGRLERVGPRVFVDYAHTPDALRRVTDCLRAAGAGPLTVVVGCGGERDAGKRPLMARAAERGADHVVLTSDNPRGEDPEAILDQMAGGLASPARRTASRAQAIEWALERAGTVLIAGKGHEAAQVEAGRRYHLDDREEARRLHRARVEGVAAERAPLSWGYEVPPAPEALLRAAQGRRGGLLVARPRPGARAELEAALEACLPGAWLSGTPARVTAALALGHRAVLLSGRWPKVEALSLRGAADLRVALSDLRGGAPDRPPAPTMPLLPQP